MAKPAYYSWLTKLWHNSRSNARRKGLTHALSLEYLIFIWHRQKGRCYWLDLPLEPEAQGSTPLKPSLDRLDNSKGYENGNVVISSFFANADGIKRAIKILKSL
jgi:hypothetical protein